MKQRIRKHIDLSMYSPTADVTGIFAYLNAMSKTAEAMKVFVQIAHLSGMFPEGIKTLAKYGWYMSNEIELQRISKAIRLIKKNNVEDANRLLVQFYTDNLDEIENGLYRKCPKRKEAIQQAIGAHKHGLYFASTPTLLIQADGICNGKLYKQSNGKKPGLTNFFETSCPDYTAQLLGILTEISAIDSKIEQKDSYFSDLNRHEVIHGLNLNYGTEINSLKALSLLCFVADFTTSK